MNYWISPSGKVWAMQSLGQHYAIAVNIIEDRFGYMLDRFGIIPHGIDAVEFLEGKGYIRYMGWSSNPHWIIYNQKPTRHQISKMFELTGFIYVK